MPSCVMSAKLTVSAPKPPIAQSKLPHAGLIVSLPSRPQITSCVARFVDPDSVSAPFVPITVHCVGAVNVTGGLPTCSDGFSTVREVAAMLFARLGSSVSEAVAELTDD